MSSKVSQKTQHQNLYEKIPSFECVEGCNDCSGPLPISPYEAKKLGIPGQNMTPVNKDLTCEFSFHDGCSKYDNRPLMCRIFGTTEGEALKCPHGKRPDNLIASDLENVISSLYIRLAR